MGRQYWTNLHRRFVAMDITFRNHPAQARNSITGEPLEDIYGEPVPLFPDQRAIYVDGVMCGYCSSKPGEPITLTVHMPVEQTEIINQRVEETFGRAASLSMPPLMPENPLDTSEVDEDDE